jgi:peptidoglycan/xylan/chitin deacetylase (PgdA/CDA1 family)
MDDLTRRGYRSLTLAEYEADMSSGGLRPKTVLITFDDAYAHVDQTVTPLLRRCGFTAVMFAPVGHLGGCNTWDAGRFPQLAKLELASVAQLRALAPEVWEVASHGLRHVDLRNVSSRERRVELVFARERLSEALGRPVLDLAYPHGGQDASVRRDVELAGFRMAFTAGYPGKVDRFQLPRWPVAGEDSLAMFRMKTSAWSHSLYHAFRLAPPWARWPTKATVRALAH